jgi:hypothetical protein
MSDISGEKPTPPITKPQPAAPASAAAPAAGVSRAALIWIGVAVVVLSFLASFLGASLARSTETAAPVETVIAQPTETQPSPEDYEAALEEILPAGSAVRAGTGVPEAGKGYEGDVYIDISTSDVYLFQDGAWVKVGNIRTSAAENLTGETGAAGDTGATGETGAPGEAGTQLSLGIGAPAEKTCETDGDIYVDTEKLTFYECAAGTWTLFGPTAATLPAPVPTESLDSNG